MHSIVRICLASLASLALVVPVMPAMASDLALETYFKGKTYAYGKFSAIDGTSREFRVDLTGRVRGQTLTLREDFVYTDGERDTKTWIFTKTGPDTYKGTREDVLGETTVKVLGDTARFSYRVDLTPAENPSIVRFFDKLTLADDGTLRNTALVTKFGFPVARVKVNFARSEKAARAIKP